MRPAPELMAGCAMMGATLVMGIPIVRKIAGTRSAFLRDLGFRSGARGTALAWVLAVGLAAGYIAFTIRGVPLVAREWNALSWLKLLSLLLAIVAGIVEEAFFRRMIMDALARSHHAGSVQVLVSALTFGVAHGLWGFFGGSVAIAMGSVVATSLLGTGLGIIYLIGGRSLAPCILAHFLIDAISEPGLLLAAAAGRMGG